jgi:hypothetical protein
VSLSPLTGLTMSPRVSGERLTPRGVFADGKEA